MIKFVETLQWFGRRLQSLYLCRLGTPARVLVLDIRAAGLKFGTCIMLLLLNM